MPPCDTETCRRLENIHSVRPSYSEFWSNTYCPVCPQAPGGGTSPWGVTFCMVSRLNILTSQTGYQQLAVCVGQKPVRSDSLLRGGAELRGSVPLGAVGPNAIVLAERVGVHRCILVERRLHLLQTSRLLKQGGLGDGRLSYRP